jgi:hypothetical protein
MKIRKKSLLAQIRIYTAPGGSQSLHVCIMQLHEEIFPTSQQSVHDGDSNVIIRMGGYKSNESFNVYAYHKS